MKTKSKTSGFFIVEILIVLVIIGILVLALLPNLTTYTQRAKFVDNLSAAEALKHAVSLCIIKNDGNLTKCNAGSEGIPTSPTSPTGYFDHYTVSSGVITVTSTATFGSDGKTAFTYILTPSFVNGGVVWSDNASPQSPQVGVTVGSCLAQGLC